uniref:Uncharacterized protein n=1 Tax=Ditylenchus dipsaci TaxID=166011 RepID=A0A915DIA6_9BILA
MPRKLTASAEAKRKKRASVKSETPKTPRTTLSKTALPHDSFCLYIKDFEEQGPYRPVVEEKTIAWARKRGSNAAAKKFEVDVQIVKD